MDYSLPTRIRWDVDFRGRTGRPRRIARQIREIAPQVVELKFDAGGISELSAIIAEIHKCHPKMVATVRLDATGVAAARWGYPIDFHWEIEGGRTFSRCIPGDARAVSFTPDEETILRLPEVLRDFARSSAEELHLPNVDAIRALAAKGHIPVPRAGQFREVSEELARSGISLEGKRIVVHDFFLFRILRHVFADGGGKRVTFPGCEAGTRLACVDWEGNVYPCESIPIRLGNLLEIPLERIWGSPQRKRVAEALLQVPVDCDTCMDHSGCRGLAHFASGIFTGKGDAGPLDAATSLRKAT